MLAILYFLKVILLPVNGQNKMSRRKVIGGIGTGLAAMAINPVFADDNKKPFE